jgi:tetratricopeptide (TPR) repeat protein
MRSFVVIFLAGGVLAGQNAKKQAPSPDPSASAQNALKLAEGGHCKEALPALLRAVPHLTDKELRYHAAMGQARCAIAVDDTQNAVSALMLLKREFPNDPEVLFICTHYFSQLAMRSSQELAVKAPTSSQARRLEAEAFESQGKWDEAAGMYRGIIKDNPKEPDVHYRLGQVLVSKAGDSGPVDEARAEFQKELEIDPRSAPSEFVLGELDRRAAKFDDAVRHFTRASEIDPEFAEAYLGLGMSLTAASKFAEAIKPLEAYTKMLPDDPAGHFQLAMAYGRTGNREGAQRESALQKAAAAKRPPH